MIRVIQAVFCYFYVNNLVLDLVFGDRDHCRLIKMLSDLFLFQTNHIIAIIIMMIK